MGSKTFTVPFRGKVDQVRSDGHVIADLEGIEPVDLMLIVSSDSTLKHIPEGLIGRHYNWDYEAGTVDVTIECSDDSWLSTFEAFINGIADLRSAEIAQSVIGDDAVLEEPAPTFKTDRAAERTRWAKGVEISSDDLATWKQANGS